MPDGNFISMVLTTMRDESVKLFVGGAAGWIMERARSGGTKALMEQNARLSTYVGILNRRIVNLQRLVESEEALQTRIIATLEDPDFWALYQSSLAAAARTSDGTKHEVLARAIEERLLLEPDSPDALARTLAVEIVPRITPAQLGYLAVAALVYGIRPPLEGFVAPDVDFSKVEMSDDSAVEAAYARLNEQEDAGWRVITDAERVFVGWLDSIDAQTGWASMNRADLAHLISTACLVRNHGGANDLNGVIPIGRGKNLPPKFNRAGPVLQEFLRTRRGSELQQVWSESMAHHILTPAGLMVGVAAFDYRAGTYSPVDLKNPFFAQPVYGPEQERREEEVVRGVLRKIEDNRAAARRAGGG